MTKLGANHCSDHLGALSRRLRWILLVFFLTASTSSLADFKPRSVPGGIARITLPEGTISATFNGASVLVTRGEQGPIAWVGLPLALEPGSHVLDVSGQAISFEVSPKTYETEHLTIPNRRKVNPLPMDYDRIGAERREMDGVFRSFTARSLPEQWQSPLSGRYSSSFGKRRVLNGQPRSPHSGLDIAAPEGTPVQSIAAGRVTAVGDYFFNGQTVMVDHGQGLISMYCHLSDIDVVLGEEVTPDSVVGKVGKTGRVTGAHLHLSVSLNNARVDPLLFFDAPEADFAR
jgi:murein DD-endopeptidase MepM/ murein hydrolase activator NlpD